MALKDWKPRYDDDTANWDNKKTGENLEVYIGINDKFETKYIVQVFTEGYKKRLLRKEFGKTNKTQAIAYAKAYMRKN